ncbi:unnamed protein product, partial [Effrenium voratum]
AADQHGFMLEALALEAPAALQRELFQQEVTDGSLRPEDWDAFQPTMARCLVLELSRRQAVKRFAQLCGGADPQVNHRQLRVSLRSGHRIRNGLRCATSLHSAAALLRAAALDAPSSDAARGVGLDAEAAEQGLELALVVASSAEPLLLLRDVLHALGAAKLLVAALRLSKEAEKTRLKDAPGPVLLVAVEGPRAAAAAEVALREVKAASTVAPAAEVAKVFERLAGRHYLVEG